MDKKIEDLIQKGYFASTEINRYGYGTFLQAKRPQTHATGLMQQAYSTKKEADIKFKDNRIKGIKIYIESMFLYLKAFIELEKEKSKEEAMRGWQGFCKFIQSVILLVDRKEEAHFFHLFQYMYFNVKFHCLILESAIISKSIDGGDSTPNIAHFVKEFASLNQIFEFCKVEEFVIVKVEKLEEYIKSNLRIKVE
ncbi:hypothetical protein TCON_1243 [Astathelohania contejeani]|uniref:Uncharacterized protein n=1 Tax=Astathelohania contejeani TaxID=164912 RepID=A0ABQ7HZC0_9MICR|nr:hypothetical protein TCON_1243 [Thelohania contejeani]